MAQFYCLLQINNSDFEVTEEEKLKFVRFATIETLHRDHCSGSQITIRTPWGM